MKRIQQIIEQTIRNGSELHVRASIALEDYLTAQHQLLDELREQLAQNNASQTASTGQELVTFISPGFTLTCSVDADPEADEDTIAEKAAAVLLYEYGFDVLAQYDRYEIH